MVLGSPVHSPLSPPEFPRTPLAGESYAYGRQTSLNLHSGFQGSGGGGMMPTPTPQHNASMGASGYLPGYLMGDPNQQSSGRMISPSKMNRSLSHHHGQQHTSTPQTPGPSAASHLTFHGEAGNRSVLGSTLAGDGAASTPARNGGFLTPNASYIRTPSAEKPGGPPTRSLFSSMHTPNSKARGTPMPHTPQLSFGGTPQHNNQSIREEVLNSSSYVQEGVGNWVTVFGFPPSASGYVLSQFSQCGTVLQHQMPPNGNWMHIKFQTKLQAQKALTKNNKILGGSIMIGVSPCTDANVEEAANTSCLFNQSLNAHQPAENSMVTNLNSSLGGTQLNRSIRPLAQAYKSANNDLEISGTAGTPNRSSGIVGKAMEYIFGW
eukprot:TCALIF_06338-PA protein Name:"Similar to NUP35 Nucleoporin NUP53 (Homo sapiens)" AED:0.34 eAED:0.39 QI:0/0/0/0.6/1/1/5/0/377